MAAAVEVLVASTKVISGSTVAEIVAAAVAAATEVMTAVDKLGGGNARVCGHGD